jgi:hypothetical protein
MTEKRRSNPDRWANDSGVSAADAQRLEIEARKRGLDAVTYEMSRAIPTSVVRDLVNDARAFAQQNKLSRGREPTPQLGPIDPTPLGPPVGLNIIDRLCEAQAKRDADEELARRLDLARRLKGG